MKKILLFTAFVFLLSEAIAQNYKFGKVSKEELQEKFHPLDSTAKAAYLYSYRRTYYDFSKEEGFRIVNEYYQRIKIYTKEGFDYATKTLRYYKPDKGEEEKITSISAATYNLEKEKPKQYKVSKRDIFDEKQSKFYSLKKMTFPNVKEGSVIELKYKLVSPLYWVVDDLEFQHDIPVKKMHISIEIPEYYSFNKKNTGYYLISPKQVIKNRNFIITNVVNSGGWT